MLSAGQYDSLPWLVRLEISHPDDFGGKQIEKLN